MDAPRFLYFVYDGWDVRSNGPGRFYWTTTGRWSLSTDDRLTFTSVSEKDAWLDAHPHFCSVQVVEESRPQFSKIKA